MRSRNLDDECEKMGTLLALASGQYQQHKTRMHIPQFLICFLKKLAEVPYVQDG